MATSIPPPPLNSSVIELDRFDAQRRRPFILAKGWAIWFQQSLIARAEGAAQMLRSVPLTAQAASIGATPVPIASVQPGLYRVSWYLRITTPATVSSSVSVTLGWTDGSVNCTRTGAAVTGNTTSTTQSGTELLRLDAATALTYATTYATVGATPMQYRLDLTVELVA